MKYMLDTYWVRLGLIVSPQFGVRKKEMIKGYMVYACLLYVRRR